MEDGECHLQLVVGINTDSIRTLRIRQFLLCFLLKKKTHQKTQTWKKKEKGEKHTIKLIKKRPKMNDPYKI